MEKFIQLLTLLLSEARDPAALLKRLLTLIVATLIFLFVSNTTEVLSFLKTFSTSAVLEDVQIDRINNFPKIAEEKSKVLYAQVKPDAVFIVKYTPVATNDYSNIVAWESDVQLDKADFTQKAVNKSSELYRHHLEDLDYVVDATTKLDQRYTAVNVPPFRSTQFDYIYTCPFYNLSNIYAGYIALAWKERPVPLQDIGLFNDYLEKVCSPQQRALGRSI